MSRRGWLLFAAMCVLWGVPYLLIRVAVRDISPASVVFLRTAVGALVLLPFAVRRVQWQALLAHWRPLLIYTLIEVTVPWWLLTNAELHLSSALAGLLIAAVPLIGFLLARLVGSDEPVDPTRLAGLLTGILGVGALVGLQLGSINLLAVGAVLLTALGYAAGPLVLSRRLADLPAVGVVVASLVISAVVWAVPAALTWPHHVTAKPLLATGALALACTAVAFLVFLALIAEVGPTRATVFTYVNPAVAVALGVTLLGERFTLGMAIGFPLVLLGSVLATRHPRRQQPRVSPALDRAAGGAVVVPPLVLSRRRRADPR
jgi:drug/metabolite transporter (DMT)-like permease